MPNGNGYYLTNTPSFAFKLLSFWREKMNASDVVPKTHARSVSLPSRPHILASQFDECLEKLKAPEAACSSYVIGVKLHGLVDLHECIDQLLELQSTQQIILYECEREWVGQVMDGSLRLLDVCGIAKDILLKTKESVQAFQSVLRRKRGHTAVFASEVSKYMTSRRNMKKVTQKFLKNLVNHENLEKGHEHITVAKMLLGAEQSTLKIFETLLSFISGSRGQPKESKWCFMSKLMLSKPIAAMEDVGDFATVDATLLSHTTHDFTYTEAQNLQYKLANLEMNIQNLEETLEHIFRHQIRTRVSLLNILSH